MTGESKYDEGSADSDETKRQWLAAAVQGQRHEQAQCRAQARREEHAARCQLHAERYKRLDHHEQAERDAISKPRLADAGGGVEERPRGG